MPCDCAIQLIQDGAIIENRNEYYKAFRIGHVPSQKQFKCHCPSSSLREARHVVWGILEGLWFFRALG
jgi:hypothetical protein